MKQEKEKKLNKTFFFAKSMIRLLIFFPIDEI